MNESDIVELSKNVLTILAIASIGFGFYHRVKRNGEKVGELEERQSKHEDKCLEREEKVDEKLSDIIDKINHLAVEIAKK